MEFWVAVLGWVMMIGFVYSVFARPYWYFDFDDRLLAINEISLWWQRKGYPEWLFLGIRFILIALIFYFFLKMGIRMNSNVM